MSEVTRKVIFTICFVAVCAIRFYFKQPVKQNQITDKRRNNQEKLLLVLTFLGMFILPLVGVFTPWLEFAAYNLPGWTGWLGTVVFILAIWLFWRSHTDLGLNWSASLEIRENHSLVDTGVVWSLLALGGCPSSLLAQLDLWTVLSCRGRAHQERSGMGIVSGQ